ncbi:10 kDa heat shock protein, mitochondrial-like [Diadema setosum]|uniref:10 kDa heat shock protein, mitochondrial-like n=1 Tax=Diadema setosum TaxID=31175 RepID=UPI003B3A62DB
MAAFRRFRPLFDRILVERFVPETRTKGGVLIPEKSQQKVNQAMVVAVGAGARDSAGVVHKVAVEVGDKVLLPEFGGTKVSFEEKDYFIFREGDILGVLQEEK